MCDIGTDPLGAHAATRGLPPLSAGMDEMGRADCRYTVARGLTVIRVLPR
ncbi:hypothetical protein ABIB26_000319 [Arthrobacter sp. UYEF20]